MRTAQKKVASGSSSLKKLRNFNQKQYWTPQTGRAFLWRHPGPSEDPHTNPATKGRRRAVWRVHCRSWRWRAWPGFRRRSARWFAAWRAQSPRCGQRGGWRRAETTPGAVQQHCAFKRDKIRGIIKKNLHRILVNKNLTTPTIKRTPGVKTESKIKALKFVGSVGRKKLSQWTSEQ